jgi:FixJ family two-component response regulator
MSRSVSDRPGEAPSGHDIYPRCTSDEIGALLHISKKTVERHRANILEKLGLRDRVELTRYAIRRGLVEP